MPIPPGDGNFLEGTSLFFCFLLQIENEADSEAKSINRIKWAIDVKTVVDVLRDMLKSPFTKSQINIV